MKRVKHRKQGKQSWVGVSVAGLMVIVVGVALLKSGLVPRVRSQVAETPYYFTAAGDYGFTSDTTATLRGIGGLGSVFNLGVGDLSYSNLRPETDWCQFVKDNLNLGAGKLAGDVYGETFPFELVTGNHENYVGADGYIDNYVAANCLPDRLGVTVSPYSKYGREYYFDYQNVRVIMLAPATSDGSDPYSYTVGTNHYSWAHDRIVEARQAGKWVVVGMHKVCLSVGEKTCEIGTDLANMLVTEKVDLVLQGHDHNYQRTKQLSCVVINSYDGTCDFDDGQYIRGRGTVFVIVGTGGQSSVNLNLTDPEVGYFAAWMGGNVNPRSGFVKMGVTSTQMAVDFVGTTPGTFADSFVINDMSSVTPTVTIAPTPTPVVSGSVTVTPSLDTFVEEDTATTRYDGYSYLDLDNRTGKNKQSLVRFSVGGIPTGAVVSQATLSLFVSNGTRLNGSLDSAGYVALVGGSWSSLTTWSNKPAIGAVVGNLVPSGSAVPGTWRTIDLTQAVSGNGTYDFYLVNNSSTGDEIYYCSVNIDLTKCGGPNPPKLVVSYGSSSGSTPTPSPTVVLPTATSTPVPAPTPIVAGSVTVNPVLDTFVEEDTATTRYDGYSYLDLDNRTGKNKQSLVRFAVSGIPAGATVVQAKLSVYVPTGKGYANGSLNSAGYAALVGGSWSSLTTWSNKPAIGSLVGYLQPSANAVPGTWRDLDVTTIVNGNNTYDFYLINNSATGDDIYYCSANFNVTKCGGSNPPKLVVSW